MNDEGPPTASKPSTTLERRLKPVAFEELGYRLRSYLKTVPLPDPCHPFLVACVERVSEFEEVLLETPWGNQLEETNDLGTRVPERVGNPAWFHK
jgi:hypothetical protein